MGHRAAGGREAFGIQERGRWEGGWEPAFRGIWLPAWFCPEQLFELELATCHSASLDFFICNRQWGAGTRPVSLHPGRAGPGHRRVFKASQEILTSWAENRRPGVCTAGLCFLTIPKDSLSKIKKQKSTGRPLGCPSPGPRGLSTRTAEDTESLQLQIALWRGAWGAIRWPWDWLSGFPVMWRL